MLCSVRTWPHRQSVDSSSPSSDTCLLHSTRPCVYTTVVDHMVNEMKQSNGSQHLQSNNIKHNDLFRTHLLQSTLGEGISHEVQSSDVYGNQCRTRSDEPWVDQGVTSPIDQLVADLNADVQCVVGHVSDPRSDSVCDPFQAPVGWVGEHQLHWQRLRLFEIELEQTEELWNLHELLMKMEEKRMQQRSTSTSLLFWLFFFLLFNLRLL